MPAAITYAVNDGSLRPAEALELVDLAGWPGYTEARWATAIANSNVVVTARAGDLLVGMARSFGDGAIYAAIVDVVVRPAFQKRGIGTRMVSLLMAELEGQDLHRVYLRAAEGTVPWYERFGFKASYGGTTGMSWLGW